MKQGGGKGKGGEFERLICKKLSLWITNGNRLDIFWRTAISGGRATIGMKSGKFYKSQMGDIGSISHEGEPLLNKFIIECKYYKNLHLLDFVYSISNPECKGPSKLFWKKLQIDAEKIKRLPMLIMKENRKPILIGLNREGFSFFSEYCDLKADTIFKKNDLYLFDLDTFIDLIDPTVLEIKN